MSDDASLVDRVGEAMAGIALDECDSETAEAWRENARAALLVMRNETHWDLRDDIVRTLVDSMQRFISADPLLLLDNALELADALLEEYIITPRETDARSDEPAAG